MKRIALFLLLAMALGIMSCDHSSSTNTKAASDFAAAEVVTIEFGKLSFYDLKKQSATLYTAETDSVVNLVYDNANHLYYTVSKNQNLTLKMLDLNEKDPQPKVCADWQLTLNDITDYMLNDLSGIYLSPDQKQIRINHHAGMDEDFLTDTRSCDLATGKMTELTYEELSHERNDRNNIQGERFITDNHVFYHINPDGSKTALSDKINFNEGFDSEEEVNDLEFSVDRIDPTGKKVIYSAIVFWGEGWGFYCLSNLDGSGQKLLEGASVWQNIPDWLSDGSLVYVGVEPRPLDDPDYEEWNTTRPCIKLMAPNGSTKTIGHGNGFVIKPSASMPEPLTNAEYINPEGSDMVILDNGKLIIYNSQTDKFIPLETEKDSVVNAAFMGEDNLYYTVVIGDNLYLKNYYFSPYSMEPSFQADWELKLNDCVSETYGETARLMTYPSLFRVGLPFDFSWDFYSFANTKFYDPVSRTKWEGWKEDEETDSFDADFMKWDEDMSKFTTENNDFYYTGNGSNVCLTNKIDFKQYASDLSYYEEPEFMFYSIDPTNKNVCFSGIIEYGDLGHGPLCLASLDGKLQMAFEDTDAADMTYGWLNDGSLVFVGSEPRPTDDPDYDAEYNTTKPCIKRVSPDGKVSVLSHASSFVTLH